MTGTAKAPFKAGGDKKLWILSSIFILAVFVYIGIQHRKIDRLSDENQLKAIELSTLKDTVAVYRNKAGESTYKLISVEIEKQNLKKSLELAAFDIKDLKDRDIKWRKVTSALRMQLAATGSGETSITDTFRINSIDTVYFQKVSDWTNNYLSIFDTEIVNRKLNFNYQYKTGISIIQEQKRKETVVSVFLTDPNASITTGNSISVKQKKRFYEKPYIWSAVAFFAGVFISR
jgi:hypothetical protein